jgi:hypothetical protein
MENSKYHDASVVNSSCHANTECKNECDAAVLKTDTLTGAENYNWYGGDFKIPKVLSEFVVQIDTESKIRLNYRAYEIKRIDNEVFLTQCRYIPPTDKVFIEGYIRKNIEYAALKCAKGSGIGGSIKDTTVHVPFKAYTKVDFGGCKPKIKPNIPPQVARYFDEKIMGKDFREADRSNIEIFNEPVYCELEWSAVYTADIDNKGCPIEGFKNEEEFQEFTDKSVLYLCIKLLQKQQVCWPYPPHKYETKETAELKSEWEMPVPGMKREDKRDY